MTDFAGDLFFRPRKSFFDVAALRRDYMKHCPCPVTYDRSASIFFLHIIFMATETLEQIHTPELLPSQKAPEIITPERAEELAKMRKKEFRRIQANLLLTRHVAEIGAMGQC